MLKTECLFSGSKGNCILVRSDEASILVDAGVSLRSVKCALEQRGIDISSLDGILITHEHSDHVKGIGKISRDHHIPIYVTEPVAKEIYASVYDKADEASAFADAVRTVREEAYYDIKDITFSPFLTPHDSVKSVGYVFSENETKALGVATDIGFTSVSVREALIGCKNVIIESNHDVTMLRRGRYPDFLKERILSNYGHLSNTDCAEFCKTLVSYGCTDLTLFHLSEDNNTEKTAFMATYMALLEMGVELKDDVTLSIAPKSVIAEDYREIKASIGQLRF